MSRDIRVLNMSEGQKIESDETMKRIGELSFRNFGTFAKIALFDQGRACVIGSGLRVEPSAGLTVNVPAGKVLQRIASNDVLACIQIEDQTVTMDAASGSPRVDIVECQIQSVADKEDLALTASVSGGTTTVTNETIDRDIKYFLQARKQTNTTTATAATAGELTGSVTIAGTIDLSSRSKLNIADGEDGDFVEIDCKGASPAATTLAEIISNINTAVGRTMASNSSNKLKLSGSGTGETSFFQLRPTANTDQDAAAIILGLSIGGAYRYQYSGTNEWFKIAEINMGASTTVITGTEILDLDEKNNWATGSSDILTKNEIFSNNIFAGNTSLTSSNIEINQKGSGNRYAYIDFIGDDTYTDFGLRVIRGNTGANTTSEIVHRGTGDFIIGTNDASNFKIKTSGTTRVTIDPTNGDININGSGTVKKSSSSVTGFITTGVTGFASDSVIRTKIVEIGDWNMDTTGVINVAHGLTWQKIISVHALIRDNTDSKRNMLCGIDEFLDTTGAVTAVSGLYVNSSNVTIFRATNGYYDVPAYNATSYNRGWIFIQYID